VSEGRDRGRIASFAAAVEVAGTRVLDIHSDPDHHRSVLTVEGSDLPRAMGELAAAAGYINLAHHDGLHPRLGGLDVCPIVPHAASMHEAVSVAHQVGEHIWQRTNLPVYFYGHATFRGETRDLPDLRRGGIAGLAERARAGLVPDIGGPTIDVERGVVCVGARDVLIAFNIWIDGDLEVARQVAKKIRTAEGGPRGVRAIGVGARTHGGSQVSMNLTSPDETGIDDAFALVEEVAKQLGGSAVATEIVGLVPERYMPSPDAKATRLLIEPGRSLESVLLN
jgi:glutamate formiminotransferase / 5-formyltetrahydrofolate cyclo-ligase